MDVYGKHGEVECKHGELSQPGPDDVDGGSTPNCISLRIDIGIGFLIGSVGLEGGETSKKYSELAGRVETLRESWEEKGTGDIGERFIGKKRWWEVGSGVAMGFGRDREQ